MRRYEKRDRDDPALCVPVPECRRGRMAGFGTPEDKGLPSGVNVSGGVGVTSQKRTLGEVNRTTERRNPFNPPDSRYWFVERALGRPAKRSIPGRGQR